MLDELLGRAELREEIAELSAEVERLAGQLEGESERRRAAVTARQDAEAEVNRLEDRIADLEGQLDRARAGEPELRLRGTETLAGDRLREVLSRLSSVETGPESAFTAMVVDRPGDAARTAFGDRAPLLERAAPCLALTDDAGLVSAALRPALPPEPFEAWADGFRVDRSWFLPTGAFALAVVRSDLFAYGEFEADERVHVEGFESDVMGAHSKGGFSQARFERRRDEQVAAHLERCRAALAEHEPERLILAGQRGLLDDLHVEAEARVPVDATGEPEVAIEAARRDVFSAELFLV